MITILIVLQSQLEYVILKKQKAFIEFNNCNNQFKAPFVIYVYFECNLETFEDSKKTETFDRTQIHTPNSCCYNIISTDTNFKTNLMLFRNKLATSNVEEHLLDEKYRIFKYYIIMQR